MKNEPCMLERIYLVHFQVSHKVFWTRYFFKVHLIELQEAKRQALKKRAEQRVEADSDMTWGDVDDLVSEVNSAEVKIPDDVQDKLLSDYEAELKASKKTSTSTKGVDAEKILAEELDKVSVKPATSEGGSDRSSPEEKGQLLAAIASFILLWVYSFIVRNGG